MASALGRLSVRLAALRTASRSVVYNSSGGILPKPKKVSGVARRYGGPVASRKFEGRCSVLLEIDAPKPAQTAFFFFFNL